MLSSSLDAGRDLKGGGGASKLFGVRTDGRCVQPSSAVTQMLATTLLWFVAAVAVLKLIDLLLSEKQKTWLSDVVTEACDVLDDAKKWSFFNWLMKLSPNKWREGLGLAVFALLTSYSIFLVSYSMYHFLLHGDFNFHFHQALQLWYGALLIVFSTIGIFVRRTVELDATLVRVLGSLIVAGFSQYISTSAFSLSESDVLIAIGIFVGYPALIVLPIWVALGLAYIASAILYMGEFIVRRIAEYPKGPVLALSALIGAIVALFKAFGVE
jgi:hypothetical protein